MRRLNNRTGYQKPEEEVGNILQEVLILLVSLKGAGISVGLGEYVLSEHACSYTTSTTNEKNLYYLHPEFSELDTSI